MRVLPLVALCGCITNVLPLNYDFSDERNDEALSLTIEALDETYSFTDWKRLDWDAVHERLAEEEDWDHTLRLLVEAIPDGHVLLENEDGRLCPEAAGSTGVLFSDTDDGDIIVVDSDVDEVEPGDVLVAWNGLDVDAALDEQPLFCFPVGLATNERRRNGRIRLLGRGEVGSTVSLTLDRAGEITLDVNEDGDDIREMLGLEAADERVSSRMLTNDVGYLAIGWEATAMTDAEVRKEVRQLWRDGARKMVVDLRNNDGGTDQTAANIAGVFTDREWFYETITMYDKRRGEQDVISEVWVEPQEVQWTLPVVALINGNTVSSGEGIAMMLARFDGIEVVGFEGTAASFGSSGSTAKLPDGWELTWPAGRSLDEDGVIQLDSDYTLEGGVSPTHRISWTAANRIAWAEDPEGFEIDYAVDLLEAQ